MEVKLIRNQLVNQNSEFSIGRRHDTNAGYYNGKIDEVI